MLFARCVIGLIEIEIAMGLTHISIIGFKTKEQMQENSFNGKYDSINWGRNQVQKESLARLLSINK